MNTNNINELVESLNKMKDDINIFSKNVFNSDVWAGEAADAANKKLNDSSEFNIDEIKLLLNNLNKAVTLSYIIDKNNKNSNESNKIKMQNSNNMYLNFIKSCCSD